MNRIIALIAALLSGLVLAQDASAQSLPALFDVVDVAPDDVLNVRSDGHAKGAKLGELAHDARDIEVIRIRDGWGLVNLGETSGWASMRYLDRQPGQESGFYRPAWCGGTEPFWALNLRAGQLVFSTPDGGSVNLLPQEPATTNPYSGSYAFTGMTNAGQSFGVLRRATCSDGMSDREYGIAADFIYRSPMGMTHYTGCCSLSPN